MQRTEPLFLPREGGGVRPLPEVLLRIRSDERVKKAVMRREGITVHTKPITLGKVVIGTYKINLSWSSIYEIAKLKITRNEGTIEGVNHPFVSSEGNPCFGTQASVVERAKKSKDWHGVMLMALDILECQTVAEDSGPYRSVASFKAGVRNASHRQV